MTNTLTQANKQWSSRPDDERFLSLTDLLEFKRLQRDASKSVCAPNKALTVSPTADGKDLLINEEFSFTNWSFNQLSTLSESPASYLRTLPAPIAADCLNYGLQYKRDQQDVGLLLYKNGTSELRAATGPNYGRIWDYDVTNALISKFGDGRTGDWKIPGEFGQEVPITKQNTTIYASDRDMFVFLADEVNRITLPNRRDGKEGSLARGFFLWNSEVGKTSLGIGTFLFDYACSNRIVWGAESYKEIRIRHTAGAPLKWLEDVQPVLQAYAQSSAKPFEDALLLSQQKKVEDLDSFLATRFGKRMVEPLKAIHLVEENRPIESLWDVTTAATAYARSIPHVDARVDLERTAGAVLDLAAN